MTERSSNEPFYLLVCECNEGQIDLDDGELSDTFDTVEEALAKAEQDNKRWGTGEVIFTCEPLRRWPALANADELSEGELLKIADRTEMADAFVVNGEWEVGPDELGPKRLVRLIADDPGWDATDGAHPAWWRGDQHGAESVVAALNRLLDDLAEGKPSTGRFSGESLEALKQRLEQLLLKETT